MHEPISIGDLVCPTVELVAGAGREDRVMSSDVGIVLSRRWDDAFYVLWPIGARVTDVYHLKLIQSMP